MLSTMPGHKPYLAFFSRLSLVAITGLLFFASIARAQPVTVAMVEAISGAPDAGLEELDYLEEGQKFALGPAGVITISHFTGCLEETITGGTVTVKAAGSVSDGGNIEKKILDCPQTDIALSTETGEAGAAISRATQSMGLDWSEQVVTNARPWFKLPKGMTASGFRLLDADEEPPVPVWRADLTGTALHYPESAPELEIGWPYRVEFVEGDKIVAAADFSWDPDLEIPVNVFARTVFALEVE